MNITEIALFQQERRDSPRDIPKLQFDWQIWDECWAAKSCVCYTGLVSFGYFGLYVLTHCQSESKSVATNSFEGIQEKTSLRNSEAFLILPDFFSCLECSKREIGILKFPESNSTKVLTH